MWEVGSGEQNVKFHFRKTKKSEIRSPYISPCFLLPQKGQQVSQGCSYSATPPGGQRGRGEGERGWSLLLPHTLPSL